MGMKRGVKFYAGLLAGIFIFGAATASASYQFNRNLYYGLRADADVSALQDVLRNLGFFSPVISTGNYFSVTVDAVKKFQTANGIAPASGYFGPLTRARVNFIEGTGKSPVAAPVNISATSTYNGEVRIRSVRRASSPSDETIEIYNDSRTNVSISGWKLTNSSGGSFTIPRGHNLPGASAIASDNITLNQYDTAYIYSGQQDRHLDFRENLCTGYLDQSSDFGGHLSHSCPKPDIGSNFKLPDHCITVFESTRSCHTVDPTKIEVQECLDFSEAHYNYQGCVNDNKNRSNFYSNDWLVWMQRSSKFLRDIHDQVTLYDQDGKIVDVYNY